MDDELMALLERAHTKAMADAEELIPELQGLIERLQSRVGSVPDEDAVEAASAFILPRLHPPWHLLPPHSLDDRLRAIALVTLGENESP